MTVNIDHEICKGCKLCIHYCPKAVFEVKNKINSKGFAVAEAVNQEDCIKCKLCEMNCPDLAIYID